ncbi:hypothetical protein HZB07_04140 [Candidatus Saganbacteria bacterium]|nr:hypothetical protein [Candidatus Saganbacteria bacterium]
MDTAKSVNGIAIRLPQERWVHVVENHCELAGNFYDVLEAVTSPDIVLEGTNDKELLAVKKREGKKYLVVIYKELGAKDGFVITAFISSKINKLLRRQIIWKQE